LWWEEAVRGAGGGRQARGAAMRQEAEMLIEGVW